MPHGEWLNSEKKRGKNGAFVENYIEDDAYAVEILFDLR